MLLHPETFTHENFYTETFTRRPFYTQTLLHTDALTQKNFDTDAFTHRGFDTPTLLHTETFTHRNFYTLPSFWRSNRISCERGATGPLEIAILHQFLANKPHFVRKSCDGTPGNRNFS